MIDFVYSDLESFKNLKFTSGLNILLVDKSLGSTNQQTRNRAGKTSFIELVHFLMGANCNKDSIFKNENLLSHQFSMRFQLRGNKITIARTGEDPSKILILDGDTESWPITPHKDKKTEKTLISNTDWKKVLGEQIFRISSDLEGKYSPTFRALFSYIVRRENAGGFILPITQSKKQQNFDWQVSISYLLGLDWTISRQWQLVRDREKSLQVLKKAVQQGTLGEVIEKAAYLRTKLTIAADKTQKLKHEIKSFKVLSEYRELEKEASELTKEIGDRSNQNVIDRGLIIDLEQSLSTEKPPPLEILDELYKEAGVSLPKVVLKRFEDLTRFHETIIENRISYLSGEMEDAERRIAKREEEINKLSSRRSEIMQILNSHGALDQFNKLRSELSKSEAEIESLKQRLIAAEQLESEKTELEFERKKLHDRLRRNFKEQENEIDRAILIFEEISTSLYEEAGNFVVDHSLNGPVFEVKIQGEKSKGIKNMQIFCFDMMIMQLCTERGMGPGFLIHDSHLFDGVDERQVAKALQIGSEKAEKLGFQYIVTMNSDALPKELPPGFEIGKYYMPVRLTDATEDGGLFGFRFE